MSIQPLAFVLSEEDGYLRVRLVGLNYIRKSGISNESASRNDI